MTYVMSDIHGEYDKFMELLDKIGFNENDTLYILGDIFDRGPHPIKIIRKIMQMPNVICIVGNHELMGMRCLPFLMGEITEESIDALDTDTLDNILTWQYNGFSTTIREFAKLDIEAQQAVIDYIGNFTTYEQITVNPAEGTVESLQNFTVSFPQYIGEIAEGYKATLRNDKTGTTYQAEMYEVRYNVLIYFPEEITKSGNYTLTIPAGAVVIYSLGFDVEELNFHYTIEGDDEETFYDLITINPAEGTVADLQNFTITFPEVVNGIASGSMATLTNETSGATYQAAMTASGHDVTVNYPEAIAEPGTYTLTIPEASLIINSLDETIAELNFHYTIKSQDAAEYTINPPEGEVYLLQNFTISYGTPVAVNEDARPTLVDDETGTIYQCNLIEIGGNAFIYKEYPLGILGNYTLHVPAGCIELISNGTVNPELTFHYTIVEKETFIPYVIENQPEGELKLYHRSGGVVREVEKGYTVEEDESPYELVYEQQNRLTHLCDFVKEIPVLLGVFDDVGDIKQHVGIVQGRL